MWEGKDGVRETQLLVYRLLVVALSIVGVGDGQELLGIPGGRVSPDS
jgi:hypothetical protein